MPRSAASLLVLAFGAAAALALASCGGSDAKLLPGETAREITANLDTVKQLAGEGDCAGAESAAVQVSEQVEALGGVDEKLKRMLRAGAARLNEVVADCEEAAGAVSPVTGATEAEQTHRGKAESEKAKREAEKAEEKRGKEEEKAEKESEEEEAGQEGNPALPPQAKGEAKGLEDGEAGGEEEAAPSGGVSPAAPAGEGN